MGSLLIGILLGFFIGIFIGKVRLVNEIKVERTRLGYIAYLKGRREDFEGVGSTAESALCALIQHNKKRFHIDRIRCP